MRKQMVSFFLVMAMLLCSVTVQAAILSKEERYVALQEELKRYFNDDDAMMLEDQVQGWSELGHYEMSPCFLLYTQALLALEGGRYEEAKDYCSVLESIEDFCVHVEEAGLGSVAGLKQYVLGRQAEEEGRWQDALDAYVQSPFFLDSTSRLVLLRSRVKDLPTATPAPTPKITPTPAAPIYTMPGREMFISPVVVKDVPVSMEVYSGPGDRYFRAANGKAKFGGGNVDVFGKVGNWYLITYWPGSGGRRVGYVNDTSGEAKMAKGNKAPIPELSFVNERAIIFSRCSLTDDPFDSVRTVISLAEGTEVTYLATLYKDYKEVRKDWAYIEVTLPGQPANRGFVPMECLRFYH